MSIEHSLSNVEKTLDVPVLGAEHAPNLIRYLESNNLRIVDAPETREASVNAVKLGTHDIVVMVPEDFGERLADSMPANEAP